MKVTPANAWAAFLLGREIGSEPVFGLRPGFRRIRSGGEFHPGEITETAPAEEKKSTGAASASCADGRPARTCDQNHRRARTRGGGAGDGVSNVTTPTLRTRQQESGKPLGVVCIAASSATCLQRPKTSAACDCKSRMEGNRTTSPTGRRRPPWIHARGARRRPSADARASRRDAIRIERKCNCDEMRPPTRRPQKG